MEFQICWVEDGVSDSKGVLENMRQAHDPSPNKQPFLGGGFKYSFVHPYLGKWSNLTNIFQMGWNHQLVFTNL